MIEERPLAIVLVEKRPPASPYGGRYKIRFPVIQRKMGEIYNCYNYSSRSGAHWHRCYEIAEGGEKKRPVYGYVRLLHQIFSYRPLDYEDLWKPIPREGKNVAGYDRMEMAEKAAAELAGYTRALIISNWDGVEAYLFRKYDYRLIVPAYPAAQQSNLAIYPIEPEPRWLSELQWSFRYDTKHSIEIGSHTLVFAKPIQYVEAAGLYTRRVSIDAALIRLFEPSELRILHPEHGEERATLQPGLYLAEHISHRYVGGRPD